MADPRRGFRKDVRCDFFGRITGQCKTWGAAPVITGRIGGGTRQPKWRCKTHFPKHSRRTHFDGRPLTEV